MIRQNSERRPRNEREAIYAIAQAAIDAAMAQTSVVECRSCETALSVTVIAAAGFLCSECYLPVCVMCGCTEAYACDDGCYWLAPGICSTHEEDLNERVERLFAA